MIPLKLTTMVGTQTTGAGSKDTIPWKRDSIWCCGSLDAIAFLSMVSFISHQVQWTRLQKEAEEMGCNWSC